MGKSLVIVESPAKAKTINRYLGNNYVVRSSKGHIRDLPTAGTRSRSKTANTQKSARSTKTKNQDKQVQARQQLISRLGVDPENNWRANYEILPDKEKVVHELRQLAAKADTIFLATDMDREGEAIAWHVQEAIGGDLGRYQRVMFNEITQKAIQAAFEAPVILDMDRVNAQQVRRFLDRVVGYMLSPLLWKKVARGLSAGRVQSVAVRLIVDREREIRAFDPEEYWDLFAHLLPAPDIKSQTGEALKFEVVRYKDKKFRPVNEAEVRQAISALEHEAYRISDRELKSVSVAPYAPFTTSTLQQAASARLGLSVKRTMMSAQKLYEAGYITYMRTDSTSLSADAVGAVRAFIRNDFGEPYLPAKPRVFTNKKQAQEAHEAIRPSDVSLKLGHFAGATDTERRLYDLIWRQFVACQMSSAEYSLTVLTVSVGDYELRIRGRIQRFDGYTRVQSSTSKKEEDRQLPDLDKGDELRLQSLEPLQHFTKPPPRYGEASLVRELEKRGIGRPSTYASIISTIQERGYTSLQKKRFYAEKIGEMVTDRLVENFKKLVDYGFTAGLEEKLDEIAEGQRPWLATLDEFYGEFTADLKIADHSESGMRKNMPVRTDIKCPKCARNLLVRTASTGIFLGCEGYDRPKEEKCTQTLRLTPGDEVADAEQDNEAESKLLRTKHKCPKCKTPMDGYLLDASRKLHICGNSPDCSGFQVESGNFKIKGYEGLSITCDKCESEMHLESGRFGKYFKCSKDDCGNTRKLLANGQPAPPKMVPIEMPELKCVKVKDHYVLRDGMAGLFLAARQFPKHRETRAPLVQELLPHQNEIDPKYSFLLQAPVQDGDGNQTVVRFLRKTSEHYVTSEKNGKATDWVAHYKGGKWVESRQKPRTTTKRKPARKTASKRA